MLKILKKLSEGDFNLTERELPWVASRYFSYFATIRRPDILEKLFPFLPPQQREKELDWALSRFYYGYEHGADNTGTLKWILDKAEKIGVNIKFWEDLAKDEEMFGYIVASGPNENIDLILEYIIRYGGKEALHNVLGSAGADLVRFEAIDKLIALSKETGDPDVFKDLAWMTNLSLERIIDSHMNPQADDAAKINTAKHLIKRQFEHGHIGVIAKGFKQLFSVAEEDWWKKNEHLVVEVLKAYMEIGGNELFKDIISIDDYSFVRFIAASGAHEATEIIEDLAIQTQDQDFIQIVRSELTEGWWINVKFADWANGVLEEDHSEKSEKEKQDDISIALDMISKEQRKSAKNRQQREAQLQVLRNRENGNTADVDKAEENQDEKPAFYLPTTPDVLLASESNLIHPVRKEMICAAKSFAQ